jgi:Uri superfamily endonuclease
MTDSGAYQLVIKIARDSRISIGALGELDFPAGYYVYTGSAMKNMEKRIERHLSSDKKLRWHIDYLLADPAASVTDVVRYYSEEKNECSVNQMIARQPYAEILIKNFGNSDCNECPSHLAYFGMINPFDK